MAGQGGGLGGPGRGSRQGRWGCRPSPSPAMPPRPPRPPGEAAAATPGAAAAESGGPYYRARTVRDQGCNVKQWVVSRQPMRGKRPRCGRCREAIEDGTFRCTPKNQTQGCYVHPDCLPALDDELQLHQGADTTEEEVRNLRAAIVAPTIQDPALRIDRHRGNQPLRFDPVQGAMALQGRAWSRSTGSSAISRTAPGEAASGSRRKAS